MDLGVAITRQWGTLFRFQIRFPTRSICMLLHQPISDFTVWNFDFGTSSSCSYDLSNICTTLVWKSFEKSLLISCTHKVPWNRRIPSENFTSKATTKDLKDTEFSNFALQDVKIKWTNEHRYKIINTTFLITTHRQCML